MTSAAVAVFPQSMVETLCRLVRQINWIEEIGGHATTFIVSSVIVKGCITRNFTRACASIYRLLNIVH